MLQATDETEAQHPMPPTSAGGMQQAASRQKATPTSISDYLMSEEMEKVVKDLVELEEQRRRQLTPLFQKTVDGWRLYVGEKKEWRGPTERWRANLHVPFPFELEQAGKEAERDVHNAADPAIQCEEVGDEDKDLAAACEKLLDYALRKNRWRKTRGMLILDRRVQGLAIAKVGYARRMNRMQWDQYEKDQQDFVMSVGEAEKSGAVRDFGPPPPDPQGFDLWRMQVNETGRYGVILPVPQRGVVDAITYNGPVITQEPIWDYRFDPNCSWQDQVVLIQRVTKTMDWLKARTGEGPEFPYDPKAVEDALDCKPEENRFTEWQRDVSQMLGVDTSDDKTGDKVWENQIELLEVYAPLTEYKHLVILNRKRAINKNAKSFPFRHGQVNSHAIQNFPIPFQVFGLSDMTLIRKLSIETDALRNLRIDGSVVSVLPMLVKAKGAGIPQLSQNLFPGMVLDVEGGPSALGPLNKGTVPESVFREHGELKGDMEGALGLGQNVRGATAMVGRISATETERRLQMALLRIAGAVEDFEEDLADVPTQMIHIYDQFVSEQEIQKIVGRDGKGLTLKKEDLIRCLEMDVRFRGATKVINKESQAQRLAEFAKIFAGQLQKMVAPEVRELMTRYLEGMGVKGVDAVVTPTGTGLLTKLEGMQMQLQLLQTQAQMMQTQQMMMQPPPQPGMPAPGDPNAPPAPEGQGEGAPPAPPQEEPAPQPNPAEMMEPAPVEPGAQG